MSFGPFLTPQNSFVVMIRSERRKFSSLMTRPLRRAGQHTRASNCVYTMQHEHFDLRLSACIRFCGVEHIDAIVPCRLDDFLRSIV